MSPFTYTEPEDPPEPRDFYADAWIPPEELLYGKPPGRRDTFSDTFSNVACWLCPQCGEAHPFELDDYICICCRNPEAVFWPGMVFAPAWPKRWGSKKPKLIPPKRISEALICPTCDENGQVQAYGPNDPYYGRMTTCPDCDGTGVV